jgi:hypothetical protein
MLARLERVRTNLHDLLCVTTLQNIVQAMKAHSVVGRRGSHIFWKIGSQMVVRLSALHAGHPLPPQENSWYSFLLEAELTPGP